MTSRRLAVVAVALGSLLAGACSGTGDDGPAAPSADDGLRIASFDFTESRLMAELYAQVVEATGTPVVRLGAVGPREIAMPALQLDLVDLLPEYLGTALDRTGATPANVETSAALAELDEQLAAYGLTALDASPAEDTNVVVVSAETAESSGLTSISDLRPYASGLRFGGPPECPDRPLCLIGLSETYGLDFAEFVPQRSQRFTAESLRRGEIDVALMFSTDPALATTDLVVLDDDRHLQPAENLVPVISSDALERWGPEVAEALDGLSAALTTGIVRALNTRVEREESVALVARTWLDASGLVPTG